MHKLRVKNKKTCAYLRVFELISVIRWHYETAAAIANLQATGQLGIDQEICRVIVLI